MPQHQRKSIRMQGYDYRRDGVYFVTLCTYQREMLFGNVVDETVRLNAFGEVVQQCWNELPNHFPLAQLDSFIVMPNHVHGLIVINRYLAPTKHRVGHKARIIRDGCRIVQIGCREKHQRGSEHAERSRMAARLL